MGGALRCGAWVTKGDGDIYPFANFNKGRHNLWGPNINGCTSFIYSKVITMQLCIDERRREKRKGMKGIVIQGHSVFNAYKPNQHISRTFSYLR